MRREKKKVGKYFQDTTFNNNLKSQSKWEKFSEELEITMSMIIGVQCVPLNYVIRDDEALNFDATFTYEEAIIQAVTLTGSYFNIDTRTLHQPVCIIYTDILTPITTLITLLIPQHA